MTEPRVENEGRLLLVDDEDPERVALIIRTPGGCCRVPLDQAQIATTVRALCLTLGR